MNVDRASSSTARHIAIDDVIYLAVKKNAQYFGFQLLNENTAGPETNTPATAFLVADHLHRLLRLENTTNNTGPSPAVPAFCKKLSDLHADIFYPFSKWVVHVKLTDKEDAKAFCGANFGLQDTEAFWSAHKKLISNEHVNRFWKTLGQKGAPHAWMLQNLALYFLIWTEAINVRHCPEVLWWIFWVCCCSIKKNRAPIITSTPSARLYWLVKSNMQHSKLADADIAYWNDSKEIQSKESVMKDMKGMKEKQFTFSNQIITPIFDHLVEEVLIKGEEGPRGQEISNRITYDDVNESLCLPAVVKRAIEELGFKVEHKKGPYPLLSVTNSKNSAATETLYDALLKVGSELQKDNWYSKHVFRKTFIERRWLLAIFRSFFRVVSFHVLLFQLLAMLCWQRTFIYVSTVVLSHAGLSLILSVVNVACKTGTGESYLHSRIKTFLKAMLYLLLVSAINGVLWLLFVGHMWTDYTYFGWTLLQWRDRPQSNILPGFFQPGDCLSPWMLAVCGYLAAVLVHFILTLRPGYVASIPGTFAKSTAEACMLPARNLRVQWTTFLLNVLFWVVTLGLKGVFDYYAIIRPLKAPLSMMHAAFQSPSASDISTPWWIFAAITRCAPAFVTTLFDTGICYSVVAAIAGVAKGYFNHNLGCISSFEDIRENFSSAPLHFVRKLCPKVPKAEDKQQAVLPLDIDRSDGGAGEDGPQDHHKLVGGDGVMYNAKFAPAWSQIIKDLHAQDHLTKSEVESLNYLDISESCKEVPGESLKEVPDYIRKANKILLQETAGSMRPAFYLAGLADRAARVPNISAFQKEVLCELFHWTNWLLYVCGISTEMIIMPEENGRRIGVPLEQAFSEEQQAERLKTFQALCDLVTHIKKLLNPENKNPTLQEQGQCQANDAERLRSKARVLLTWFVKEQSIAKQYKEAAWWRKLLGMRLKWPKGLERDLEDQKVGACPACQEDILKGCLYGTGKGKEETRGNILQVVDHMHRALHNRLEDLAPASRFATSVLAFFVQSMTDSSLPQSGSLDELPSLTTLVPHFEEDVMYSISPEHVKKMLNSRRGTDDFRDLSHLNSKVGEGDTTTISYLRSIHSQDWICFLERLKAMEKNMWPEGIDVCDISEVDFDVGGLLGPHGDARDALSLEMMLWASNRSQVLSRTIEGMACYGKAISFYGTNAGKHAKWALSKYSMIVASQVYGRDKKRDDAKGLWRAWCTDEMLKRHADWLKVAYLDESSTTATKNPYQYSVLIGHQHGSDGEAGKNVELYRVRLPVNKRDPGKGIRLGEGKPENQNHALIFALSDIVQCIDMNQAGNFAEALKIPNLLTDFAPEPVSCWGWRSKDRTALVGFREYLISEDGGAPAQFAASTEWTFGTIVQRVMAVPGSVRFHYGHPDLWDKKFVMTRGGVSRATKGLHVSEDVFGGYNHILRGGKFKYREYTQVGKGRDTGFDSINGFESKIAGGNGEQVISREVYRLGARMDFFRLLSFYHTGPGFYINSTLIMLGVYLTVWVLLFFAVTGKQVITASNVTIDIITGESLAVSGVQLAQLGMLGVVMFFAESSLERGVIQTLGRILAQVLTGSWMFFIFRARTSAYYFMADLMYGGAKYISTGRGHAIKRVSFVKIYTSYARSHLYWGVELLLLLWLLYVVGCQRYWHFTWGPWLVVFSILLSPIWFNPDAFSLTAVKKDFVAWQMWMLDHHDKSSDSSWLSWHTEQMKCKRRLDLTRGHLFLNAVLCDFAANLPTVFISIAALYWGLHTDPRCIKGLPCTKWTQWGYFSAVVAGALLLSYFLFLVTVAHRRCRRAVKLLVCLGLVGCLVAYLVVYKVQTKSKGRDFWLWIFVDFQASLLVIQAQLWLECIVRSWFNIDLPRWRRLVDFAYRVTDYVLGYAYFVVLFVLAFLRIPRLVQAALLFNVSYANTIIRGMLLKDYYVQASVDQQINARKANALEALDG